ncbi:MAG: hypothetical protein WA399_15980 [Acidobacteriaceae bacterium]
MRKLALLLVFLSPLAAFGQGIVSIAPQQCVWRAGDPSKMREIQQNGDKIMYQNKVSLIGFLGGDAEIRNANNRSFTTLSLATKSSYKDSESGQYVAPYEANGRLEPCTNSERAPFAAVRPCRTGRRRPNGLLSAESDPIVAPRLPIIADGSPAAAQLTPRPSCRVAHSAEWNSRDFGLDH